MILVNELLRKNISKTNKTKGGVNSLNWNLTIKGKLQV